MEGYTVSDGWGPTGACQASGRQRHCLHPQWRLAGRRICVRAPAIHQYLPSCSVSAAPHFIALCRMLSDAWGSCKAEGLKRDEQATWHARCSCRFLSMQGHS